MLFGASSSVLRMMHFHMVFPTTILHEAQAANGANEPFLITVNPHVLPQRVLPRIRLLTNLTLMHSRPTMPDRMLQKLRPRITLPLTFRTRKITFLNMNLFYVLRPFPAQGKRFRTNGTAIF